MLKLQARFYPSWFHENYGMVFGERFALDVAYRVELNQRCERLLHKRFGDVGLGSADPEPDSGLFAVFKNLIPVMFGAAVDRADEHDGWVHPIEATPDEAVRISVPDVESDPCIGELVRQGRWFEDHFGPTVLNPGIDGILNSAIALYGDALLTWLVLNPDVATHVLRVLRDTTVAVHEYFRSLCGTAAPMGLGNCTMCMIRPQMYRDVLLPLDMVWCRRAERFGLPFGFHMDGRLDDYADIVAEFPYLHRVDMGSDTDVARVRRVLPDKVFRIYLYPHQLVELGPEGVANFLDKLVRASGNDEDTILQLDVSAGMDDAVVRTVATFVRERGVRSPSPEEPVTAVKEQIRG